MDTGSARKEIPVNLQLKIRKFSYSLLAYVYQKFFTKHHLPEGIDVNYIIPDSDIFVNAVGGYLDIVSAQQTSALRPMCQQLSCALKHTEEAFIAYLRWRCEKMKYEHRYTFMCMCSLVSHLVLQYFEKKCFRFSMTAVDALYEIICDNDLIVTEFGSQILFYGFLEFCIRTEDDKGKLDRPRLVQEHFLDFLNKNREPPETLLKDGAKLDKNNFNPSADACVSEDIKYLDTPESTGDESSEESSMSADPSSAGSTETTILPVSVAGASAESSSASTSDAKNVELAVSAESSVASVDDTENVEPSKGESMMDVDPEGAVAAVCSLCNMDCRSFLKHFVDEFKMKYT